MSLIDLVLSQKVVILTLAIIGLILLLAVGIVVLPIIRRKQKQWAAQRRVRLAEKAAQAEQQKQQKHQELKHQKRDAQKDRAAVPAVVLRSADQQSEEPETVAVTPQVEPEPATATEAPVQQVAAEETTAEASETESTERSAASDVQDILDSVFVNDEEDSRYEVLLRGIEVVSSDELLAMATRIAAELRRESA